MGAPSSSLTLLPQNQSVLTDPSYVVGTTSGVVYRGRHVITEERLRRHLAPFFDVISCKIIDGVGSQEDFLSVVAIRKHS